MLSRCVLRGVCSGLRGVSTAKMGSNLRLVKFYSDKPEDKKAPSKSQSILTEDLLAKAGFEDPEAGSKQQSEKIDNELETEESSEGPKRRKRRAQTSKDKQRERNANYFYMTSLVGGIAGIGYMSRDWDSEEEQKTLGGESIENGYSPQLMYERLNKRLSSLFSFFSEPVFENLLPPPAPEGYRRPLTLVLTLDDFLIHSSWDTKHGWRTAKRPGLDYFLAYLSGYYEIVIFATNSQMYSEKAVSKLDPYHAYISYALFREGCRYKDGKLIKDLSLLNRDLSKTVIIDVDPDCYSLQPENAIPVPKWDGQPDDYLVRMIPFLEYLATQQIKDVRPILASFNDKENIIPEFEQREIKLREKWRADNAHLFNNKPNAGNAIAKLLGLPQATVNKEPKMPLDIIREHGQLQYEHFQKYIRENAPKIIEEEQKLKDEFGKITLNKLMTEGNPSPEDIAKAQAEMAKKNQN